MGDFVDTRRGVGDTPAGMKGEASTVPERISLSRLACAALASRAAAAGHQGGPVEGLTAAVAAEGIVPAEWGRLLMDPRRKPHPADAHLLRLGALLPLTPIEQMIVALLVAAESDPLVGGTIAVLQAAPSGHPTVGLAAALFEEISIGEQAPVDALLAGTALHSGLLRLDGGEGTLVSRRLSLPLPLYLALRGHRSSWPGAHEDAQEAPLPTSLRAAALRHAETLAVRERSLIVRSGSPAEGRAAAAAVVASLGRRPVFLHEGAVADGLGPWLLLRDLVPVFCYELGPGETRAVTPPVDYRGPILFVVGSEGSVDPGAGGAEWIVPVPGRDERMQLWKDLLGDDELAGRLAREHRHGAVRIHELGRLVRRQLELDAAPGPTHEHVRRAACSGGGTSFRGLAQTYTEPVVDEALVASPPLQATLRHLLAHCRERDGLAEGLGPSAQTRYRPGVRALFVGPSGTGKTLAAGWLATRLGMALCRVDLAAVTSKYIGETEKHLARLLSLAEHEDVVLLFDEADSMFGRRTEVRDANDRFANAQTNYLLQRIESFESVAILTSNSRSRLDAAFTRRLDAIIEFAMPGPDERRDLWLAHLGGEHDVSSRQINKLAASCELAGGHVRNVVFAAAVMARSERRRIAYPDVVEGLKAEYRKMSQPLSPEVMSD
jgi:hypothetical protein